MKGKVRASIGIIAFAGAIIFRLALARKRGTQLSPRSATSRLTAYDAPRETTLQGTVVSYTEKSSRAPIGARVTYKLLKAPWTYILVPPAIFAAITFLSQRAKP